MDQEQGFSLWKLELSLIACTSAALQQVPSTRDTEVLHRTCGTHRKSCFPGQNIWIFLWIWSTLVICLSYLNTNSQSLHWWNTAGRNYRSSGLQMWSWTINKVCLDLCQQQVCKSSAFSWQSPCFLPSSHPCRANAPCSSWGWQGWQSPTSSWGTCFPKHSRQHWVLHWHSKWHLSTTCGRKEGSTALSMKRAWRDACLLSRLSIIGSEVKEGTTTKIKTSSLTLKLP